jgi:hypothetical protein
LYQSTLGSRVIKRREGGRERETDREREREREKHWRDVPVRERLPRANSERGVQKQHPLKGFRVQGSGFRVQGSGFTPCASM